MNKTQRKTFNGYLRSPADREMEVAVAISFMLLNIPRVFHQRRTAEDRAMLMYIKLFCIKYINSKNNWFTILPSWIIGRLFCFFCCPSKKAAAKCFIMPITSWHRKLNVRVLTDPVFLYNAGSGTHTHALARSWALALTDLCIQWILYLPDLIFITIVNGGDNVVIKRNVSSWRISAALVTFILFSSSANSVLVKPPASAASSLPLHYCYHFSFFFFSGPQLP